MITVGYGDLVAKNQYEILYSMVVMLTSCVIYAYQVSAMRKILFTTQEKDYKLEYYLNCINQYMQMLKVPLDLKLKVSAYVEYYWSNKSRDSE